MIIVIDENNLNNSKIYDDNNKCISQNLNIVKDYDMSSHSTNFRITFSMNDSHLQMYNSTKEVRKEENIFQKIWKSCDDKYVTIEGINVPSDIIRKHIEQGSYSEFLEKIKESQKL